MADYKLKDGGVIRFIDGAHIPDDPTNSDWMEYQDWLGQGNTPDPADPPPPLPSNDEIYDIAIKNQKVLKAVVLSINDGTLVPGANVSNAVLKATVKANM